MYWNSNNLTIYHENHFLLMIDFFKIYTYKPVSQIREMSTYPKTSKAFEDFANKVPRSRASYIEVGRYISALKN